MQYLIEQQKSYTNLDTLRQDLALMDVNETPVFQLQDMKLTTQGTLILKNKEYLLTETSLKDALQRGGLHRNTGDNFFQENQEVLDSAIVNAANAYYQNSRYATSEVKFITRANHDTPSEISDRVLLGIPSSQYTLVSHEQAIDKILPKLSSGYQMKRANISSAFMELAFTDPINTTKDAVGEVVELGFNIVNSQGCRTRALMVSAFSLRLICTNGATASDKMFALKYKHKGNMFHQFESRTKEIMTQFSDMMKKLPLLERIPITEKFIAKIKPSLVDAIKTKKTEAFLEEVETQDNMMELWNKVTNLPHKIENPEARLKLEQLGFWILTAHLMQRTS